MADQTSAILKKAQQDGNFAEACLIVQRQFVGVARIHAQAHKADASEDTWTPDLDFWPNCARRAKRARLIWLAELATAKEKAAQRMRRENLEDFAEALESGEYAALSL